MIYPGSRFEAFIVGEAFDHDGVSFGDVGFKEVASGHARVDSL